MSCPKTQIIADPLVLSAIRLSVFRYPKGLPEYRTGHPENPKNRSRITGQTTKSITGANSVDTNDKKIRAIYRALERADEIEAYYNRQAEFLAEVEAGIKQRERSGKTNVHFPGYHTQMRQMARTLRRRLQRLGFKRREAATKCLALLNGYPIVPDLIHHRDLDIPHQWKSIAKLRKELNEPLPDNFYCPLDKWERLALESYPDDQIEQELLAFCQMKIEGKRKRGGLTEYLLP